MNIDDKARLSRQGDVSPDAIRARLVAARETTGMLQKQIAEAIGVSATTYNSQEARGAPSVRTMRYYYRQHRVDFNFLLHGDFAQLPTDVQDALFRELQNAQRR